MLHKKIEFYMQTQNLLLGVNMCLQYSRNQTDCLMAYWTQPAAKIIQNDLKFTEQILKIEMK